MDDMSDDFLSWVPNVNKTVEDPFYTFIDLIAGEVVIQFILVNLYGFLFQVFILPFIGIILFMVIMYGGASAVRKLQVLRQIHVKGYPDVNEIEASKAAYTWMHWVSRIWFGYEAVGLENIPTDQTVLYIGNRGIFPSHYGGLFSTLSKYRQSRVFGVLDSFHSNLPILKHLFLHMGLRPWNNEECVRILNAGSDLVVTPGGPKEIRDADEHYKVEWGTDTNFADIAKETKTQIVPFFCVNLLESFWMPFFVRPFLRGRFTPKDCHIAFSGGGLPVKLAIVFGHPISCDKLSTEEIIQTTKLAIEQLRDANQRIPGSKLKAVFDRLRNVSYKTDCNSRDNTQNFTVE